MIKNHVVAKDGFEPPIARSELAVLPLYHMAFLKTAYLHRLAAELFTSKFFNYEKFSIPIKWIITINMMSNKVDEAGFKPTTLVLSQGFIN